MQNSSKFNDSFFVLLEAIVALGKRNKINADMKIFFMISTDVYFPQISLNFQKKSFKNFSLSQHKYMANTRHLH